MKKKTSNSNNKFIGVALIAIAFVAFGLLSASGTSGLTALFAAASGNASQSNVTNSSLFSANASQNATVTNVSQNNYTVALPNPLLSGYVFTSFFGDDRVDNGADNTYNRTSYPPAYNGNLASTKKIGSTQTSLLKDSVIDTKGKYRLGNITVKEFINLYSSSDYSSSVHQYVARSPRVWYSVEFNPALPVCLDANLSLNDCPTNLRLDRAGLQLRFLGDQYSIVGINSTNPSSFGYLNSITLLKETGDQILSVGQNFTTDRITIRLDAISAPQGSNSVSTVSLSFFRSDSSLLRSISFEAGSQLKQVVEGHLYVQVPDAFYSANNSSARIIVGSKAIHITANWTLSDTASNINRSVFSGVYGKWATSFKDARTDGISKIQIGNDFQLGILRPGEGIEIITPGYGAPAYRWTFLGSNLVDADYTTLAVEPITLSSIQIGGNASACSYSAVRFTSSRVDAFRFGADQTSQVWFIAKNQTSDVAGACKKYVGQLIYQNGSSVYANVSARSGVPFYYPGTGSDTRVNLLIALDSSSRAGAKYVNVTVPEILGLAPKATSNGSAIPAKFGLPQVVPAVPKGAFNIALVFGAGSPGGSTVATDLGIRDALGLTTAGKINYTAPRGMIAADQSPSYFGNVPFYSPRGSFVTFSPSSTRYVIYYASKIARANYVLSRG